MRMGRVVRIEGQGQKRVPWRMDCKGTGVSLAGSVLLRCSPFSSPPPYPLLFTPWDRRKKMTYLHNKSWVLISTKEGRTGAQVSNPDRYRGARSLKTKGTIKKQSQKINKIKPLHCSSPDSTDSSVLTPAGAQRP